MAPVDVDGPPLSPGVKRSQTVVYPHETTTKDSKFNTPIKILTLLAGGSQDQLTGHISSLMLRDMVLPGEEGYDTVKHERLWEKHSYEALSYCWGLQDKDVKEPVIKLYENTETWEVQYKHITANLELALRHLRYEDKPRRLWIDAICIDQENEIEKSQQIPIMDRIYRKAKNVCIWLGESDTQTKRAFSLIDEVQDLKRFDTRLVDKSYAGDWEALSQVMRLPWFSRRWIVQEVAFARHVTVHCGHTSVTWEQLADAVSLFTSRAPEIRKLFREQEKYNFLSDYLGDVGALGANRLVATLSKLFRKSDNGDRLEKLLSLESLVSNLSAFNATKPHDTIYAVLSLANDTITSTLDPPATGKPSTARRPGDGHTQTEDGKNGYRLMESARESISSHRGHESSDSSPHGPDQNKAHQPPELPNGPSIDDDDGAEPYNAPGTTPLVINPGKKHHRQQTPETGESVNHLVRDGHAKTPEDARRALDNPLCQGNTDLARKLLGNVYALTNEDCELEDAWRLFEERLGKRKPDLHLEASKTLFEMVDRLAQDGYERYDSFLAADPRRMPQLMGDTSIREIPEDDVRKILEHQKSTKRMVVEVLKNRVKKKIFTVDYKKKFDQVCRDFLEFIFRSSNSLDMLCRPWAPEDADRDDDDPPSWICNLSRLPLRPKPDGTYGRVNADLLVGMPGASGRTYSASRTTRPELAHFGEKRDENNNKEKGGKEKGNKRFLVVQGFSLGEITEMEAPASAGVIPRKWLDMGKWTNSDEDPPESFWRTLVADRDETGLNPPAYYKRACRYAFSQRVAGGSLNTGDLIAREDISKVMTDYLRRVQSVVYERRLIKAKIASTEPQLGLVSEDSQIGDLICIFRGCSVPVIVRKTKEYPVPSKNDDDDKFWNMIRLDPETLANFKSGSERPMQFKNCIECRLIGECYVYGIMDGEGFKFRDEAKITESNFLIH